MDYDRLYSDAMFEEKKAFNLAIFFILIVALLFFFAAVLLKEPILGVPLKTMKNVLMGTSIIIAIGAVLPKMLKKNDALSY